ncbi:TetR/AcrR family transcriptional regulator [Brevundimonas sp.]|uniref:TetR/AcrR family transcriptional regulator n=1 Tax=Brevundimonas sp. TaxID=1871086 RepID=UPI002C657FAD|nr:TetR/AcrR family transcriptional regulator [Brevundimonas sp.]HWQ85314.1 TetR/AcrR family transcriptional regulator [Brevundimonas sp.]
MAGRPRSFDRDEALSRALQVFWSKGYADASMTDLTGAMGINSPSLYAAFGSKEDLFREAVRLYTDTAGVALWASMREARTAREAIEGLLLATAEANSRYDRPKGCLLVLSGAHPDALPDGACGEVAKIRTDSMATMEARLREGQAAGEIAADADPAAIAAFYTTVQQGMTFRAREGATAAELRGTARAAMLAWDGLAGVRRS